ncbi:MAG: GTP 3',8-cyclase MoaA [Deltaproteobacteria bacterium]|jgi:cyclic pyranopterin phosphate synthase|nr:GTP 3',8-cyclase MoaA [Deltaproteobacteria bacterium]
MLDSFGRAIDYVRLSVTDRCNLRCAYCMPEEPPVRAGHNPPLGALVRIARVMASLGVRKIKLTGGEPTVRRDLPELVRVLKALPGVANVTLTTNGTLLAPLAEPLALAGLDAVNVSLDTLRPNRFRELTRLGRLEDALAGLDAACAQPRLAVKVNCVPMADSTPDDLANLAALARDRELHVRFIELMPMGLGGQARGLPWDEVRRVVAEAHGPLEPCLRTRGNGPASYFSVEGFKGRLGFIGAMNSCFCDKCNRLRVTADGWLKSCLHMDRGRPLPLEDEEAMAATILKAVAEKPRSHLFLDQPCAAGADRRLMSRIGG